MTAGPDPVGGVGDPHAGAETGALLTGRVVLLAIVALAAGFVLGRRLLVTGPPAAAPRASASTVAAGPAAATGQPPGAEPATIGELAPAFRLSTPDGTPMALADLRGRPVLLNFFATWCGPCRVEMPHLQRAWERHAPAGLVVLGVDVQERPEQVPPYLQELGLTFPTVVDGDGAVTNQYQVGILPTSYFIDREGRVARKKVGFFASEKGLAQELASILTPAATASAVP